MDRAPPEIHFRLRDKKYLAYVRSHPCLICGGASDAHHLTHAQPRGVSLKTGDQFAVPLCRRHHDDLHQSPMSEQKWWDLQAINPIKWAEKKYNGYCSGKPYPEDWHAED